MAKQSAQPTTSDFVITLKDDQEKNKEDIWTRLKKVGLKLIPTRSLCPGGSKVRLLVSSPIPANNEEISKQLEPYAERVEKVA